MEETKKFLKKLTSRKFLMALIGVVSGLSTAFSNSQKDSVKITGYILAGVSAVIYMIVEGQVDSKFVASTVTNVISNVENVKGNNGVN